MSEDDGASGQGGATQVICGKQTGGVGGIRQGQVHEDALEHNERADGVQRDADDADDPVDVGLRGPAEPENTRRHEGDGEQGRHEAVFLGAQAVALDVRFQVPVDVGAVDGDADDAADHDAGEDHAEFANVEAVDAEVDEWEGLEEGIVDS